MTATTLDPPTAVASASSTSPESSEGSGHEDGLPAGDAGRPVPAELRGSGPAAGRAASVRADLERAREAVSAAEREPAPAARFLAAHQAALRTAAVVLAVRARPGGPARPRNAWRLLAEVAPELGEWAGYFGVRQPQVSAVRSGATGAVSSREADDLVRDAARFLDLVERAVAPPGPSGRRPC